MDERDDVAPDRDAPVRVEDEVCEDEVNGNAAAEAWLAENLLALMARVGRA